MLYEFIYFLFNYFRLSNCLTSTFILKLYVYYLPFMILYCLILRHSTECYLENNNNIILTEKV